MTDRFRVGVVTSPHGVRGELKVYPTTEEPERFQRLERVRVCRRDREEERKVVSVRFQNAMVLLRLEGVDSRDVAEQYRKAELYVDRAEALPLEEGEYYVADLISLTVTEEGEVLGTLKDVLFTGANDVYLVERPDGGELLIPAIKECIRDVDLEAGRMEVHLLPGLLS